MKEANTNNTIILDTNKDAKTIVTTYNSPKEKVLTVNTLTAVTHNALLQRLIDNGFNPITITIHDIDIQIAPLMKNPEDVHALKNVGWFNVTNAPYRWETDSLFELSAKIADYDNEIKADERTRASLRKLLDTKIKGHTSEELKLGNDLNISLYEGMLIEELCEIHNITPETANQAITLSNNWEMYSDVYKSQYGYRPSFPA